MACFHPIKGYQAVFPDAEGRRPVLFQSRGASDHRVVELPCGQCVGCRLERSRQWALRCVHEASLYEYNSFVTLTYSDECLPVGGSLRRRDLTLFLKRLRQTCIRERGYGFRYYGCGEYGDSTGRPHYHLLLFDLSFEDCSLLRRTSSGHDVFRSPTLDRVWSNGLCEVGSLTFESAAYVARYCLKKVNGAAADEHYRRVAADGSSYWLTPEFAAMSLKPGIGKPWLDKFGADVYPDDVVRLSGGRTSRPPRFYDTHFEASNPEVFSFVKEAREPGNAAAFARSSFENSKDRLAVREEVVVSRQRTFSKRSL